MTKQICVLFRTLCSTWRLRRWGFGTSVGFPTCVQWVTLHAHRAKCYMFPIKFPSNSYVLCRTLALGTSLCFKEAGWGSATLRHLTPFRETENSMLRCVACVLFYKSQLLRSFQLNTTTTTTTSSVPLNLHMWWRLLL